MLLMNTVSSKHKYIGVSSLLSVGILFGLSGVMAKYLSSSLNPYQVVEYRFVIALFSAFLMAMLLRKRVRFGEHDKRILALFSLSFPFSVILFTLAIFNTSVALAVFSFYIATLVSIVLIGTEFWKPLDSYIRYYLEQEMKTISPGDTELYYITDDLEEVLVIANQARERSITEVFEAARDHIGATPSA